jgi:hypothetical protein
MKEMKVKNDEFLQRTAELRERMTGQLGEVAKLGRMMSKGELKRAAGVG